MAAPSTSVPPTLLTAPSPSRWTQGAAAQSRGMRRKGPAHTRQEGASASPRRHTWVAARSRGRTALSIGTVLELGSRAWRKPRPWLLAFPCPSRVVTQAARVVLHALRMSCKARDSLSSIGGVAVLGVRLSHPPAGCKHRGAREGLLQAPVLVSFGSC